MIPKHITLKQLLKFAFIVFVLAIYFQLFFIHIYKGENLNKVLELTDYRAFFRAATMVHAGKISDLYTLDAQKKFQTELTSQDTEDGILSFRNPPLVAYVYSFLPINSYPKSFIYASICCNFLIFLSIIILFTQVRVSYVQLAIILMYLPVCWATLSGQTSAFILLSLVLIYVALKKQWYLLAGLLTFFLSLKPQYIIFIPAFLIITKKGFGKLLLGVIITQATSVTLNIILYGKTFITDYFLFVINTEGASTGTRPGSNINLFSLQPFADKLFGGQVSFIVLLAVSLLLNVIFLLLLNQAKNSKPLPILFSSIIIMGLVLNVHTLFSDLSFLLIPLFLVLDKRKLGLDFLILYFAPFLVLNEVNLQPAAFLLLMGCGFSILSGNRKSWKSLLQTSTYRSIDS